ncbi:thioredoxin family protein [Hymenobacter cheonanensis]|uniref:thioredoxin family protein n=1 Tax=Hymenobacter sp. CA2-7 TaxID=3063993 RepID=UPI0027134500|nr:thioredoxin family protein [Hymenobacter sp. CA2-7]MDO7884286.1 thioredoxin family protein [Hymenobacter sp. CA2-7]
MKHLLLAGLLAVGLSGCGSSAPTKAVVIDYKKEDNPQALAQFIRSATPAHRVPIVYFYADWCGPCRRFRATLPSEQVDDALQQAAIIKVNVDSCQDLVAYYHLTAIPAFVKVDAQGQPLAVITSDKWKEDEPAEIAPVMEKLVNTAAYDLK